MRKITNTMVQQKQQQTVTTTTHINALSDTQVNQDWNTDTTATHMNVKEKTTTQIKQ